MCPRKVNWEIGSVGGAKFNKYDFSVAVTKAPPAAKDECARSYSYR